MAGAPLNLGAFDEALADEMATPERDRCAHVAEIAALLAEVRRLNGLLDRRRDHEQAIERRVKTLAEAIATAMAEKSYRPCPFCTGANKWDHFEHDPDCIVRQARAWRDQQGGPCIEPDGGRD